MASLAYNLLLPYLAGILALSGLIIPSVTFVRAHFLTRMDGLEVPLFAAVVGNALTFSFFYAASAAGHPTGWAIINVAALGTFAGFWSSGFVKGVKYSAFGSKVVSLVESALAVALPKGVTPPAADAKPGDTPNPSAPSAPSQG